MLKMKRNFGSSGNVVSLGMFGSMGQCWVLLWNTFGVLGKCGDKCVNIKGFTLTWRK